MDDQERTYWLSYIHAMASALGLLQWRIRLMDEPADDPYLASCQVVRGRRVAFIHLSANWSAETPEEQRQAIVHELLHVWINPILINVESATKVISRPTFNVLYHTTDMQVEYAVDGIAAAIAPLYPLPMVGDGECSNFSTTPNQASPSSS